MRYLNDYDIQHARARFTRAACPNRLAAAIVVDRLAEWANDNSDGWAYWQKPRAAADRLMALIESRTSRENDEQERTDATDAELAAALKPVKAFLTRQKVDAERRELILRAATTPAFEVVGSTYYPTGPYVTPGTTVTVVAAP